jgi:hypothetical protein
VLGVVRKKGEGRRCGWRFKEAKGKRVVKDIFSPPSTAFVMLVPGSCLEIPFALKAQRR